MGYSEIIPGGLSADEFSGPDDPRSTAKGRVIGLEKRMADGITRQG